MNHDARLTQAVRFVVHGRVQGVGYRAATQDAARRLGLRGWVRNLPDGSVELVAYGELDALAGLASWLRAGPELARVEEVRREPWSGAAEFTDFTVRR